MISTSDSVVSLSAVTELKPAMAVAAQRVYDEWSQDENGDDEMLGRGGICQDIASAMSEVLAAAGVESTSVSAAVGEQHVYVIAQLPEGVFEIDINPYLYESGGGYNWTKKAGVEFSSRDVTINRLSPDPSDYDFYSVDC